MTPCSTLEQRWSACRARIYGEERVRDFAWCNLWKPHLTREEALRRFEPLMARGWHSRPCTSPRRHQCRAGDYDTRQPYQYPGLHERDWCQAPLAGVRASDWLKELELDDAG